MSESPDKRKLLPRVRTGSSIVLVAALLCLASCQAPANDDEHMARLPTFSVKGQVFLDGKPAEGVMVRLHLKESLAGQMAFDPRHTPMARVDGNGNVSFATYELDDGAPAGKYVVTFSSRESKPPPPKYIGEPLFGPEKLRSEYNDPSLSKWTVTVTRDGPNDIGHVDLRTGDSDKAATEGSNQP